MKNLIVWSAVVMTLSLTSCDWNSKKAPQTPGEPTEKPVDTVVKPADTLVKTTQDTVTEKK